jgi:hypothetical protein
MLTLALKTQQGHLQPGNAAPFPYLWLGICSYFLNFLNLTLLPVQQFCTWILKKKKKIFFYFLLT